MSEKSYDASKVKLLVHGQGVVFFTTTRTKCSFSFYNKYETNGIFIEFTPSQVNAKIISSEEELIDEENISGLRNSDGIYYWVSLDSQNQRLQAGIGEARIENVIYKYEFPKDDLDIFHQNKTFLESIVKVNLLDESFKTIYGQPQPSVKVCNVIKDPITLKIPLIVRNTDELSMDNIASGNFLPKSNLATTSEKLYNCISGKKFILDTSDFPNFSNAIEYSLATPGKWCHEKIKDKSREFNKDKPNILETYLRITLGENNGESPGIPYVMEIWPPGHYSPIHSHGGAHAIIRVLYGSINVSLYPYLSGDNNSVEPFANVDFYKDDVTWISPTLNQTHKLENRNRKTTCVTIQCYLYDSDNNVHYDYFDYLDNENNIQTYEPDSDMDFVEFKKIIRYEWENRETELENKKETEKVFAPTPGEKLCSCTIA